MRPNPKHLSEDERVVRSLIDDNPWCTLVSNNAGELVASHYPVLVDQDAPQLTVVTHVGRPDDQLHGFGERQVLLIVQGRHGYISPSWYAPGAVRVPTWNFSVAHCYGVPQILDEDENLRVLSRLVERFERHVEHPMLLDTEHERGLSRGTVGLRIPIARFVCKLKLSQDKDPVSRRQVMAALRAPGPYNHPRLADDMELVDERGGLSPNKRWSADNLVKGPGEQSDNQDVAALSWPDDAGSAHRPAAHGGGARSPASDPAGEVMISRQPVVDAHLRVAGYRLAYATGLDCAPNPQCREAAGGEAAGLSPLQLFHDALSVVGLEELVGTSVAHLPISRKLLFAIGVPPVRPDRVVLRLPYKDARDPELTPLLDQLAWRGFTLELDSLPGPDFSLDLLDVFGSVELDLAAWSREEIAAAVPRVHSRRAVALAANVADHEQFTWAHELGIELFEGPFYAKPDVTTAREVPVDRIGAIAALARIQGHSAPVEELEEVIGRDVGLSVKLLRYINSAFFGLRNQIGSIRHAVMMLGSHGVARWALLVALVSGPDAPREISIIALTRGRLCEVLGAGRPGCAPEELFMIGVLSAADVLMGVALDLVVAELPLADAVSDALLRRGGPAGSALDAALAYERGDFAAASLHPHRNGLLGVYRDALQWATSTVSALA